MNPIYIFSECVLEPKLFSVCLLELLNMILFSSFCYVGENYSSNMVISLT